MTIITIKTLRKALDNTLGKKGMDSQETARLAEYVMSFFGFEDTVVDNVLRTKDRDVFYMLEEEKLLSTFQDTVTIKKGKLWRIHYWVLNKHNILKYAEDIEDTENGGHPMEDLYGSIPDDAWSRE